MGRIGNEATVVWQCTYNVTLRGVRVTNVAVEKQEVLLIMIVCLWP